MSPFVLLETPSNRLGFAANGQNDEVGKMGKMAASVVSSLVQTDGSFAESVDSTFISGFCKKLTDPRKRLPSVVSGRWSVVSGQWSVVGGGWWVVSGEWWGTLPYCQIHQVSNANRHFYPDLDRFFIQRIRYPRNPVPTLKTVVTVCSDRISLFEKTTRG